MANLQQTYVYWTKKAMAALGATDITTTGAVATGNLTVTGTAGISGNVAVNTSKFTVAAATGNTVVAGTLGVTGDVAVNTNKFTVTAASGNTVVAGTLGVTSDVAVNTNKFNVTAASGNTTVAGTLGVTGATTLTGGVAPTTGGMIQQYNHAAIGALASRGTDGASTAGTIYYCGWIPEFNMTITNLNVLQGTNVGVDKIIASIYTVAGVLLQSSALAGISTASADTFLQCPLIAPQAVVAGTEYLLGVSINGTTDGLQRAPAGTRIGTGRTGSQAGVFGTLDAISTPATGFTADLGPFMFAD